MKEIFIEDKRPSIYSLSYLRKIKHIISNIKYDDGYPYAFIVSSNEFNKEIISQNTIQYIIGRISDSLNFLIYEMDNEIKSKNSSFENISNKFEQFIKNYNLEIVLPSYNEFNELEDVPTDIKINTNIPKKFDTESINSSYQILSNIQENKMKDLFSYVLHFNYVMYISIIEMLKLSKTIEEVTNFFDFVNAVLMYSDTLKKPKVIETIIQNGLNYNVIQEISKMIQNSQIELDEYHKIIESGYIELNKIKLDYDMNDLLDYKKNLISYIWFDLFGKKTKKYYCLFTDSNIYLSGMKKNILSIEYNVTIKESLEIMEVLKIENNLVKKILTDQTFLPISFSKLVSMYTASPFIVPKFSKTDALLMVFYAYVTKQIEWGTTGNVTIQIMNRKIDMEISTSGENIFELLKYVFGISTGIITSYSDMEKKNNIETYVYTEIENLNKNLRKYKEWYNNNWMSKKTYLENIKDIQKSKNRLLNYLENESPDFGEKEDKKLVETIEDVIVENSKEMKSDDFIRNPKKIISLYTTDKETLGDYKKRLIEHISSRITNDNNLKNEVTDIINKLSVETAEKDLFDLFEKVKTSKSFEKYEDSIIGSEWDLIFKNLATYVIELSKSVEFEKNKASTILSVVSNTIIDFLSDNKDDLSIEVINKLKEKQNASDLLESLYTEKYSNNEAAIELFNSYIILQQINALMGNIEIPKEISKKIGEFIGDEKRTLDELLSLFWTHIVSLLVNPKDVKNKLLLNYKKKIDNRLIDENENVFFASLKRDLMNELKKKNMDFKVIKSAEEMKQYFKQYDNLSNMIKKSTLQIRKQEKETINQIKSLSKQILSIVENINSKYKKRGTILGGTLISELKNGKNGKMMKKIEVTLNQIQNLVNPLVNEIITTGEEKKANEYVKGVWNKLVDHIENLSFYHNIAVMHGLFSETKIMKFKSPITVKHIINHFSNIGEHITREYNDYDDETQYYKKISNSTKKDDDEYYSNWDISSLIPKYVQAKDDRSTFDEVLSMLDQSTVLWIPMEKKLPNYDLWKMDDITQDDLDSLSKRLENRNLEKYYEKLIFDVSRETIEYENLSTSLLNYLKMDSSSLYRKMEMEFKNEKTKEFNESADEWIMSISDFRAPEFTVSETIGIILDKTGKKLDDVNKYNFTNEAKLFARFYNEVMHSSKDTLKRLFDVKKIKLQIENPKEIKKSKKVSKEDTQKGEISEKEEISETKKILADVYMNNTIKQINDFENFKKEFIKFIIYNALLRPSEDDINKNYDELFQYYNEKIKGKKIKKISDEYEIIKSGTNSDLGKAKSRIKKIIKKIEKIKDEKQRKQLIDFVKGIDFPLDEERKKIKRKKEQITKQDDKKKKINASIMKISRPLRRYTRRKPFPKPVVRPPVRRPRRYAYPPRYYRRSRYPLLKWLSRTARRLFSPIYGYYYYDPYDPVCRYRNEYGECIPDYLIGQPLFKKLAKNTVRQRKLSNEVRRLFESNELMYDFMKKTIYKDTKMMNIQRILKAYMTLLLTPNKTKAKIFLRLQGYRNWEIRRFLNYQKKKILFSSDDNRKLTIPIKINPNEILELIRIYQLIVPFDQYVNTNKKFVESYNNILYENDVITSIFKNVFIQHPLWKSLFENIGWKTIGLSEDIRDRLFYNPIKLPSLVILKALNKIK